MYSWYYGVIINNYTVTYQPIGVVSFYVVILKHLLKNHATFQHYVHNHTQGYHIIIINCTSYCLTI